MPDLLFRGEKASMRDVGPTGGREYVFATDPAEARRVQDEIERALLTHRFEERDIFSIKLALEEALVNAMKHGNHYDRGKKIMLAYRITVERFDVAIVDEGPGFDPGDVPDPRDVENLERSCGRGLCLMRHYMSEVVFHPPGNHVTMAKFRATNGKPQKET